MIAMVSACEPSHSQVLVASARRGDAGAREELGRRVGRSAYVFALQMTGDREAALDVAQDMLERDVAVVDFRNPRRPVLRLGQVAAGLPVETGLINE